MHGVFFFIVNQPFTFFFRDSWNYRFLVSWSYFFFLSLVFSSVKASDGLFLDDKLEDSRFSELEKPNLNRDMLLGACVWEIDLPYNAEKWHYTLRHEVPLPSPIPHALRDEIFMVKVNYNQQYHAMCTWSSCSPAREFSLFSETAQLGWVEEDESEKGRVEMVSVYNWLGLLYCWMKSLLSAGTFSPIAVLKICLPKGQVVRAFSVVRPKIYLSRAIGRVGISSPGWQHGVHLKDPRWR